VFAYYYIWFNHSSWNRAKKDYPLIGTYSSGDASVMRRQIQQAKSAGIDGFIVSWKNTTLNDQRLRTLMAVAAEQHFKLAMIYQGLDFYRRPLPVSEVAADFTLFRDKFAGNPAIFQLGGKPLTIWSGTWAYTHAQVAQVTAAVRPSMLVLSTEKSAAGFNRIADVTDGDAYYWSSVNPATNTNYGSKLDQMSRTVHRDGKYWIAPFAPGFDARLVGGREFVPRDNGQTLRTEYANAVRSSPDVLGLISWNEFSENSYVEPSVHYRYQSLDVLRQLRGTTVPQPTGPAAPSETGATHPHIKAPAAWPNVLRLAGFPIALVIAVGFLGYARRRASRPPFSRPLPRRSDHRNKTL
jgi:Glycosyl hydrolase family 71